MAVKKKDSGKTTVAAAGPKKAAVKTAAPKAEAPAAQAAPKPAAAAPKKAAVKKAAPAVKLTDTQRKLLDAVHATKETGMPADKPGVTKSLEALKEKKLIKKGAKNKVTGHVHYHISKAGEKHISSTPSTSTPPTA